MSNLKKANLVSIKSVIYRIINILPKDSITEDEIEEWAYEAYESFAPVSLYQTRTDKLAVINNKAPIPKGAFSILMVLFRKFTESNELSLTNDRFGKAGLTTEVETYQDLVTGEQVHVETTKNINIGIDRSKYTINKTSDSNLLRKEIYRYIDSSYVNTWAPLPMSTNILHGSYTDPSLRELIKECGESFSIQNGCIVTSFEVGEIAIAYNAIPTNEKDEILIPDLEYVRQAIESYVLKRYWQRQMNMREEGGYRLYQLYSKEFELASAKATGELMLPGIIDFQNLRNLNKYIKEDTPFSTALGALNNQQVVDFRDPRGVYASFMPYFTNFPLR